MACAHAAPPRATTFGKKVGLGELVGDREATALLKDVLGETFELGAENPELHLHVDATMSWFDEPVLVVTRPNPQAMQQMLYRHAVRMNATLRLVEDATGAVLAEGRYEEVEKGPEQPQGVQANEDLAVIAARRIVRQFVEQHRF